MARWRVLIVEDDADIALVHREMVTRMPMFDVCEIAESGEQALARLARVRPDLVLLDLSLPGIDGLAVMRKLRDRSDPVEVIAVTASRGTEVVRAMVHLGVVDYLVKPFSPDRMRQALGFFLRRMSALDADSLEQQGVDALCASGRRAGRFLPKGLVAATLDDVRREIDARAEPASADDVAAATGISRVTARRYLEFLLATQHVDVEVLGNGPGRPRRLYRTCVGVADDVRR